MAHEPTETDVKVLCRSVHNHRGRTPGVLASGSAHDSHLDACRDVSDRIVKRQRLSQRVIEDLMSWPILSSSFLKIVQSEVRSSGTLTAARARQLVGRSSTRP